MTISLAQILTWLLLGALAGVIIHFVTSGRTLGRSIVLGLVGALVGGLLFGLLNIQVAPELMQLSILDATITFSDIVAALVGALLVLGAVMLARRSNF
jgi:uncharacterized membrane protein YeaQ/YmgE (transglycosylase-associated protein family)